MKWIRVTTRDGRALRFTATLSGLEALALGPAEHVPALEMDEVTASVLADARGGKLPNIWR